MVPRIAARNASQLRTTNRQASPALSIVSSASSTVENGGNKRKAEDDTMDREKKRKLMNRVAAQQSRDRKKQHMDELEKELNRLRAENALLQEENMRIKDEKEALLKENLVLKNCQQVVKQEEPCLALVPDLDLDECVISSSSGNSMSESTFESAALISGPLPKEQVDQGKLKQLCLWLMQWAFLTQVTSQSQTSSPSCKTFGRTLQAKLYHLRREIKAQKCAQASQAATWDQAQQLSWNRSPISCTADRTIPRCS